MPAKRVFGGKKLFNEIRFEVAKVVVVQEALNAGVLFFALNILLTLLNMNFYPSAAVAVVFFVYRITRGMRKDTLVRLEKGNPEVHEILRTAYEYQEEESLMAQGLIHDLQRKLETVSAGVLLDPKKVFSKLGIIAALAFIPILIFSFLPFLIQENPLDDVALDTFFSAGPGSSFKGAFNTQLNESAENIFGSAQVIQIGDQELRVDAQSGGGTRSFENVEDAQRRDLRTNDYPSAIDPQEAEYYQESQYSESDINLINQYSCKQKGTC